MLQTAYHDAISETSVSRRTLQKLRRFLTKPRNKEAVRLTNRITLTILKIQEGAVRNGQLPSAKSIRMTALLGRLGRSFLIVMYLFEDSPRDLKSNKDCSAQQAEQCDSFRQGHKASPLSRLRPGEPAIRFHTPGSLPGKLDHLFMQTAPEYRRFGRYFYFTTVGDIIQQK